MAPEEPRTLEVRVHGPIARSDVPGLSLRICALLAASVADVVLCDVSGVEPDAVAVEALARLQLAARRHRCVVRLRNASRELLDLVAFVGLEDVLAADPGSGRGWASPACRPGRGDGAGHDVRARHRHVEL